MYADKYVHKPSEVPEQEHYAIIRGTSVHIPGDERSRQCPGHGYPASTEYFIGYEAYLTLEKLRAALKDERDLKTLRVIKVVPTKLTTEVTVHLS